MEENPNNLCIFESLLRNQSNKRPAAIYGDSIKQKYSPTSLYTAKDVITNISQTMKAMHKADCVKLEKNVRKNLSRYKKLQFLSVNMLPASHEEPAPPAAASTSKFDTQCVSSTQLLDVIKNAEDLQFGGGMTQEFATTFCIPHEATDSEDPGVKETHEIINKSPVFARKEDVDKQSTSNQLPYKPNSEIEQPSDTKNLRTSQSKENVHNTTLKEEPTLLTRNKTEILNESIDIELSLENIGFVIEEEMERPDSPVFTTNVQTKKPSLSQHLVVDLEQFENFERMAANMLFFENLDLNTATALIKSQLLPEADKQLSEEQCSPILGTKHVVKKVPEIIGKYETDEEELETSQILMMTSAPIVAAKTRKSYPLTESEVEVKTNDNPKLENLSETNQYKDVLNIEDRIETERSATPLMRPTSVASENKLEDEILFSSDEEEDYVHKNIQELPLSIALETSFYTNQSDILERTMYVGFQTASNKSIQVSVDSYDKAKKALEPLSLKDLVEKCSGSVQIKKLNQDCGEKDAELTDIEKISHEVKEQNKDVCFQTASGKNIAISKEAMFKSNAVFRDFDSDLPLLPELERNDIDIQVLTNIPEKEKHKEDTWHKVGNIFKDIDLSDIFDTETKITLQKKTDFCSNNGKTVQFEGFKTASNKNIHISEKALHRSCKVFQDIDKLGDENVSEVSSPKIEPIKKPRLNCGINDGPLSKRAKYDFKDISSGSSKNIQTSHKTPPKLDVLNEYLDIEEINEDIALLDEFGTECDDIAKNNEMNDDNNILLKTDQNPAFVGFKTASDKRIDISKQAMAETMRVFKDIDPLDTGDVETESVFTDISNLNLEPKIQDFPAFKGFQTASNKHVVISKEALEKTKSVFQDIYTLDTADNLDKDTVPQFIGFQTASKKCVVISKEALTKSKRLFQDIDEIPFERPVTESEPVFHGFQTASKRTVTVSKEAIEKTKTIFQDIDQVEMTIDDQKQKSDTRFKKPVRLCEEVSPKTASLFQHTVRPDKIPSIDVENIFDPQFGGFQTASKKPLQMSKEALERARNLFKDIDKNEEFHHCFRTVSNKDFDISSKALETSKKLFEDMEPIDDVISKETADEFFQTACNKSVTNNEDLVLAKANLPDDPNPSEDLAVESKTFCGFQTASNKAVKISGDALARTLNIFQDIIDSDNNADVRKFEGFKTANKKTVGVSEEALATTKVLFNGNEDKAIPSMKTSFLGFQTASKKKVEVSDEALAKTKEIFKDFEMSQKIVPPLNSQGFKTCNNNNEFLVSNEALVQSKNASAKMADVKHVKTNSDQKYQEEHQPCSKVEEMELHKIIDTQVQHNFKEPVNTEEFCPKAAKITRKRSGSPILSCPKAKRRKNFKTPYKLDSKIEKPIKEPTVATKKHCNTLQFNENYKKQKCYTLKMIQQLEIYSKDEEQTDPYILQFKFDDLLQFRFSGERNNLNSRESLSIDEIRVHFEESVSKKIIPDGWFENHIKLVLWKLISYEIRFPRTMSNTCNAKTVIDQLKYRYDKELYKVERPVLRRILERDDVSTRTMILCVVSIFADGENVPSVANPNTTVELLVTDGWYCVRASTDRMLARMACECKIAVGVKLVTHGAELANCDQGIAPWEDTSKVRLKLAGNSTRRARWDARLGRHGNAAILSPLSSVRADGGKVAKTRILVTRVYPLLYVEKFEDGSTVTRSERLEHIYQMKYETDRQIQMEKLYEDIEREFSDAESQESEVDAASGKPRSLESGSQIASAMRRSKDPAEFRSTLTESQQCQLADHSARSRERLLAAIQARVQERLVAGGLDGGRNVVSLLKVRVAGVDGDGGVTKGLMSIWRPGDAILEILQEGAWVDVMNVVPTGLRYSELQLSAGRQSTFDKAKVKETDKLKAVSQSLSRTCSSIRDLTRNPQPAHEYNETDTVGIVIDIEPSKIDFEKESIRNQHLFQNVFMADSEKHIVCVNFWGGLKKFGFENILDTGQVIAAANLQKRAGNTRKNIPQYRATEFTYFTKTPKSVKARDMVEEMVKKFHGIDRRKFCQDSVQRKHCMATCQSNTENVSPYRFNNTDYNISRNKMYIESPLVQKPGRKDEDLNLTGLDFESTFKHRDTQDLSPGELERKRRVRQKMAKLKMYGEPPPISPIHIINKSMNARNDYKSPLTAKLPQESPKTTDTSRNYQNGVGVARFPNKNLLSSVEKTKERNVTNITSPLVSMNRTYVKNVNPIRLNFSNSVTNEENSLNFDHFAEEFDDSPPLSLD